MTLTDGFDNLSGSRHHQSHGSVFDVLCRPHLQLPFGIAESLGLVDLEAEHTRDIFLFSLCLCTFHRLTLDSLAVG